MLYKNTDVKLFNVNLIINTVKLNLIAVLLILLLVSQIVTQKVYAGTPLTGRYTVIDSTVQCDAKCKSLGGPVEIRRSGIMNTTIGISDWLNEVNQNHNRYGDRSFNSLRSRVGMMWCSGDRYNSSWQETGETMMNLNYMHSCERIQAVEVEEPDTGRIIQPRRATFFTIISNVKFTREVVSCPAGEIVETGRFNCVPKPGSASSKEQIVPISGLYTLNDVTPQCDSQCEAIGGPRPLSFSETLSSDIELRKWLNEVNKNHTRFEDSGFNGFRARVGMMSCSGDKNNLSWKATGDTEMILTFMHQCQRIMQVEKEDRTTGRITQRRRESRFMMVSNVRITRQVDSCPVGKVAEQGKFNCITPAPGGGERPDNNWWDNLNFWK